jgi:hypothetical protein
MKFNAVSIVLVGVLFFGAVVTIWLSLSYILCIRQIYRLDAQTITINNTLVAAQSLANQAIEYSKRNPAIDPILLQFDLKPRQPAAKPGPQQQQPQSPQQQQPAPPAEPRPNK